MGLGVAAINTGNNLLYLLCSTLLGLVIVSGILSEQTMRGLKVESVRPDEIFAGRPAVLGAWVRNGKRWLASYSVVVEAGTAAGASSFHVPRLAPGGRRLVSWEGIMPARGRHRLPGLRLATRFPFGLFAKVSRVLLDEEVIVYPSIGPVAAERLRASVGAAGASPRRRGRGHELYNLRDYRPGDDHRLIHWRSTARAQVLTVREFETEAGLDTRIRLCGTGRADPARLERALSEAGSLAVHLLRAGACVELAGPDVLVPAGRGRDQEQRILTALALYRPGAAAVPLTGGPGRALRDVQVDLD